MARRKSRPVDDAASGPLSRRELVDVWHGAADRYRSVPPEHAGVIAVRRHVEAVLGAADPDDSISGSSARSRRAGELVDAFCAAEDFPTRRDR
jgi:hypothetical protein